MKSQKITDQPDRRRYDDACGTALALDLVGERWALLVVRELMFGARRFGELRAGLPGISANVLSQRLEGLEASGIVERRRLPPPASVQVYALTPWGQESDVPIMALGRWAVRSPAHDPTLPLSAASLMMSFRTMFSGERAEGVAATIGFTIGEERFVVRIGGGAIAITRGDPEGADLQIAAGDAMTVAAVVYGGAPLASLSVTGDAALARRFTTLFPLPDKLAR